MTMDLWQLQVFCKVVEEKSFSKAGKRLNLSQPTISSHVKELENHFGCRLIDRLAREALPTAAGELLYSYAVKLKALRDETESAMAGFQGKMKGFLSVGGSTIPGGYILPAVLAQFTNRFPEIRIALTVGDTQEVIDGIASGKLAMGVVGARSAAAQIFQERLLEDEMQLIVPANHPWAKMGAISLDRLREAPFITREPGSGTLKSIELCLQRAGGGLHALNAVLQMGNTVSVIQAIKGGAGVSILSTVAVADDIAAGRLAAVHLQGVDLKRSFYLTRLKNRSLPPVGQAFIGFLKERLDHDRPVYQEVEKRS